MFPRPRWDLLAVCGLSAFLALAARWHWAPGWEGANFRPHPDALEYAAAARALAVGDGFALQVGPLAVRPRYPPGWPMILAVPTWGGLTGRSLWRVTGLFGALQASLLSLLAWTAVVRMSRPARGVPPSRSVRVAAGAAALAAGGTWAFGPLAVAMGRTLLSDEPAAFAAAAALAASGLAFLLPAEELRRARTWAVLGGLAWGLALALRPANGVLLALPLGLLALAALGSSGARPLVGRLGLWVSGAAVFPLTASATLVRSGLPPLPWSAYALWIPDRYRRLGDTFDLRYALEGNPDLASLGGFGGLPHLEVAARVLLGLPGLGHRHLLGVFWPTLGWLLLALLPLLAVRAPRDRRRACWLGAAGLVWGLGHVAFFGLYFFPAPRFFLPPLAVAVLGLTIGAGWALSRRSALARLGGAAALALLALSVGSAFASLRRVPHPELPAQLSPETVSAWLALSDQERAGRLVPFDPVEAQAIGALDHHEAAEVRVWGELPPTIQVRRLRMAGEIP